MLIIGELINASRSEVREAIKRRDEDFICNLAKSQEEAGANWLDLNCGTFIDEEPEIMRWLVSLASKASSLPLCIDSPNELALAAGLESQAPGSCFINSISAETKRMDKVLPLVLQYRAKIVALCMSDDGIPQTADERLTIVDKLVEKMTSAGVPLENIYFDPLVQPISSNQKAGYEVLQTITAIGNRYPQAGMICGLSNVSYGLPHRQRLNRVFLVQAMACGLRAAILNPLDKGLMAELISAEALLGEDAFCGRYLKAHRKGLLD